MKTVATFWEEFPQPTKIKVEDIVLHQDIPADNIMAAGTINFKTHSPDIFTPDAARFFVRKHPPEGILNSDGTASCFAGLRSLQMAYSCLSENEEIFILIHENLSKEMIQKISLYDLYLTYLGLSSDDRLWPVDLVKIWQQLGKENLEILTPNLVTKKKLSAGLNVPYQRLFPTRKFKKKALPKSEKSTQTLFPISDRKHPRDERIELEKMLEKAIQENNIVDEISIRKKITEI